MRYNRAQVVDENFIAFLHNPGPRSAGPHRERSFKSVDPDALLEMFESQMVTRHLDLIARDLRARDIGFYTIASAGHEGNAAVGRVTRHTDPAFLHYRSGAFMAERSRKIPGIDIIYDTLLSQMAAVDDPAAGGRHKVWGSKPLWVLPQTSTIASHLPKAVGTALAIVRGRRLGIDLPIPEDSIAVCSFGDASCNHSTAAGAFNAARWGSYQSVPMPILFVCEDNGYGISVRTPDGWIESNFRDQPGLTYFQADGLDLIDTYITAKQAVDTCRSRRVPVFLHLKLVRMLGHAGSDMEAAYRSFDEIEATEAGDPLLRSARTVLDQGLMGADSILELYEAIRDKTRTAADRAAGRPRLSSAAEVMRPLAPYSPDRVRAESVRDDYHDRRLEVFESEARLPENSQPRHMAVHINHALFDLMAKYREAVVFGEDVATKGGVYHVTAGLARRFKFGRVFNTPLDEQTILGLAQGAGYAGLLPIPEIQYLAYFHNACDQIRGEACSQQFFSNDQFRNPMIVRVASLAYQKGFGGHFHNDNSIAALRDIPGLIIVCPSRGDDAAALLRTAAALAKIDGRVIVYLEPIALYMTKDLHEKGDGQWLFPYPPPSVAAAFGEARVYSPAAGDLAIITYGNGVYFSLRVAERLRKHHGAHARVVDLRWLNPLNHEAIARHADECGRVLVVDEGRRTGGLSETIFTSIIEHCETRPVLRRVVGEDSYIPLGPAADHVLPSEDRILVAALALIQHTG